MEIHNHGIDIIGGAAVMIHHADLGDGLQQRRTFHLLRAVGIDDDQNAGIVTGQQRILTGNENIPIFRNLPDFIDQTGAGIVFQINDDACLFASFPAQTADAHGRTERIQIGVLVPHDKHMACLPNQLHQGVGGDTGTHLAAILGFGAAAAVEGEIEAVFDDGLITATAEGHFNAQSCEIVSLLKVLRVNPHSHGHGGGQTCGVGNLVNVLQQGELVLDGTVQILLFKNKQETVSLQPAQQTVIIVRPLSDGIAELCV